MDPILKKLGKRIREIRLSRGLSQEALAHEANLDRSYVGGVERGERNISLINLHKIASALQLSPDQLLKD